MPGGICLSGTVHGEIKGKIGAEFEDLGEQKVKNIAEPLRAYRIALAEAAQEAPAPESEIPTIAVLPFTNMSGDPEQQYFSDGISEDIITELSRFSSLQVIDDSTGKHLWAERYDRELEDIFAVQDELVSAIVAALGGRLEAAIIERALRKPTESLAAYDYYLRGLRFNRRFDRNSALEGRAALQRAVALDPDFAKAHALSAEFTLIMPWFGSEDEHAYNEEALAIARRAVELDPDDGVCHAELGVVHLGRMEHAQARHYFEQALALNPHDLWIWTHYAWYLTCIGEPEQALERLNRREAIEPFPPSYHLEIQGTALYSLERYQEAVASFERMTILHPTPLDPRLSGGLLWSAWTA